MAQAALTRAELDETRAELKAAQETIGQLEASGDKLAQARGEFRDRFLKMQEADVTRQQQEHLVQQAFATLGASEVLGPQEACQFALEKARAHRALREQHDALKSSFSTLEASLGEERGRSAELHGKAKHLDDARNGLLVENDKMRARVEDLKTDLARQTAQLSAVVETAEGKARNALALAGAAHKERQASCEKELAAALSKRVESDMRADRLQRIASAAQDAAKQTEAMLQQATKALQARVDDGAAKLLACERRRDAAEMQESHTDQRLRALQKSVELQLGERALALDVERRTCQSLRAELEALRKDMTGMGTESEALSTQGRVLAEEKQAAARASAQQLGELRASRATIQETLGAKLAALEGKYSDAVLGLEQKLLDVERARESALLDHNRAAEAAAELAAVNATQIASLTEANRRMHEGLGSAAERVADMEEKEQQLIAAAYDATEMAEHYRADFIQLTTTLAAHSGSF